MSSNTTGLLESTGTPDLPELPASEAMARGFFIYAWTSTLITTIMGTSCNVYLLFKFLTRKTQTTGFQKMCTVKSMANIIICSAFVFWVLPVTALSIKFSDLPNSVNRKIGMMSCTWAYDLNALMSVCMACNRFYALYFPLGIRQLKTVPLAQWVVVICLIIVTILGTMTFPDGCGYVFDSSLFLWHDESLNGCAGALGSLVPWMISSSTITTHSFNFASVFRLLTKKQVGIREEEARKRRRRWKIMFTQSFIQDCLQLWDIINVFFVCWMRPEIWWQFFFGTYSMILVLTLDGIVMFICNQDVHPKWMGKYIRRKSVAVQVVRSTSGNDT